MNELEKIFDYPTASLNIMKGGIKTNVVPDMAEAIFDIRLSPGTNHDEIKKRIHKLANDSGVSRAKISFLNSAEGYYEDPSSYPVNLVANAVKTVTGVRSEKKIMIGYTDAIHLKPYANVPCIGFGAGIPGTAHTHNERVRILDLLTVSKIYSIIPLLYSSK
jgi:acetylornithine deacetylase/succinyl-diaminopimelate desuccinylase-like protein